MKKAAITLLTLLTLLAACEGDREHLAEAIRKGDSVPFLHSVGVSTLISDSGVVRYKLIAEEWDMYKNDSTLQETWKFMKGAFMQRFDKSMKVDLYAQADTVYYHNKYLWEMRGRVVIHNADGTIIRSEELFYDEREHYIWSNLFTHIEQKDREIEGYSFRSNEDMTDYKITNTHGSFLRKTKEQKEQEERERQEAMKTGNAKGNRPDSTLAPTSPQTTQQTTQQPNVAPSAPGKLEAEMRRRGRST